MSVLSVGAHPDGHHHGHPDGHPLGGVGCICSGSHSHSDGGVSSPLVATVKVVVSVMYGSSS